MEHEIFPKEVCENCCLARPTMWLYVWPLTVLAWASRAEHAIQLNYPADGTAVVGPSVSFGLKLSIDTSAGLAIDVREADHTTAVLPVNREAAALSTNL